MKNFFLSTLVVLCLQTTSAIAQTISEHQVQRGETFASIAKRYGISEEQLRTDNPRYKVCYAGLVLKIVKQQKKKEEPAVTQVQTTAAKSAETVVEVEQKDTAYDNSAWVEMKLNEAEEWKQKNKYKKAVAIYDELLQHRPRSAKLLYKRALVFCSRGDTKKAMNDLRTALECPDCDEQLSWTCVDLLKQLQDIEVQHKIATANAIAAGISAGLTAIGNSLQAAAHQSSTLGVVQTQPVAIPSARPSFQVHPGDMIPCNRCNGTGKCPSCHGSGILPTPSSPALRRLNRPKPVTNSKRQCSCVTRGMRGACYTCQGTGCIVYKGRKNNSGSTSARSEGSTKDTKTAGQLMKRDMNASHLESIYSDYETQVADIQLKYRSGSINIKEARERLRPIQSEMAEIRRSLSNLGFPRIISSFEEWEP